MPATLSEDEIDDLLYIARTGEKDEFNTLKGELFQREKVTLAGLLEAAKDETSGNGVLHMAAANGHNGKLYVLCLLADSARLTSETRALEDPLRRTFKAVAAES
jgi:uncharacterized protein